MKSIDLTTLSNEIHEFIRERDWDQFHSVKNLSMALSVEASELVEIFQWMSEIESNKVSEQPEEFEKLQDEVADIFIYLLRIMQKTNIDLEPVVRRKMKKNAAKYPIERAYGHSRKYNKL
jgi:dCTP diphosphatase